MKLALAILTAISAGLAIVTDVQHDLRTAERVYWNNYIVGLNTKQVYCFAPGARYYNHVEYIEPQGRTDLLLSPGL